MSGLVREDRVQEIRAGGAGSKQLWALGDELHSGRAGGEDVQPPAASTRHLTVLAWKAMSGPARSAPALGRWRSGAAGCLQRGFGALGDLLGESPAALPPPGGVLPGSQGQGDRAHSRPSCALASARGNHRKHARAVQAG